MGQTTGPSPGRRVRPFAEVSEDCSVGFRARQMQAVLHGAVRPAGSGHSAWAHIRVRPGPKARPQQGGCGQVRAHDRCHRTGWHRQGWHHVHARPRLLQPCGHDHHGEHGLRTIPATARVAPYAPPTPPSAQRVRTEAEQEREAGSRRRHSGRVPVDQLVITARTVFSILQWPRRIWTARRLPVALKMIDALVRRIE
ncbi:hypothetical protein Sala_1786 [Sphingopyxis alaskensis RB2256]|uniref:Uncharacterized protein n=1 Tax=Sphingopyxis alaskensis (strain DSM 13593 / LMG 18877 / RB2256) TaxID=317655 RepID=Q1GS74_SPHAL|nr:hypothetical protein Sala_1786 [Sphingopyxis alaskensis RB2256]